jgi:hypothetical protein
MFVSVFDVWLDVIPVEKCYNVILAAVAMLALGCTGNGMPPNIFMITCQPCQLTFFTTTNFSHADTDVVDHKTLQFPAMLKRTFLTATHQAKIKLRLF